jgi:F-box protein 28
VLDELLKILKALQQTTDQPPRAHEFLQELRDISSMAMEHFEEKIAPTLKTRLPALPLPYPFNDSCSSPETSGEAVIKNSSNTKNTTACPSITIPI